MAMVAKGDGPTMEVAAAVAKSLVAVAEDEPPVEIAVGAAQSPVAAVATPIAALPFAESKDMLLRCN